MTQPKKEDREGRAIESAAKESEAEKMDEKINVVQSELDSLLLWYQEVKASRGEVGFLLR